MDYKFIILAIVGIIIAYLIYSYFFSLPGKTLTANTYYLLDNSSTTPISFNTLGSTIYISPTLSFYGWIYVNQPTASNNSIKSSASTPIFNQTLFYLNGITGDKKAPSADNSIYYAWGLDTTGQNLYVYYNTSTISASNTKPNRWETINVLSNIPMQSWAFIAVVLDNTNISTPIMDVYMNGKLVNSIVLNNESSHKYVPPVPPSGMQSSTVTSTATAGLVTPSPNVNAIQFGSNQDVYLSGLTAFNVPLTPDVVQTAYLSFAGKQNSIASATTHYGISFTQGSGRNLLSNDFQIW